MIKVHFDFETYSECDIKKHGAYKYAQHPSTEVICMAYAYDEEPVKLWLPGDQYPVFLNDLSEEYPYELHAFASFFEWCIWKFTLKLPVPRFTYWHDTAAKAAAMALPRSLSGCCMALGLPSDQAKNKRGYYLINRLSVPQRDGKRNYDFALLDEFYEYCMQDVVADRTVAKKVLPLNPQERQLWILDQEINARGINVDLPRVNDALYIIDEVTKTMNQVVSTTTLGRIKSTNTIAKVKAFLADIDVNMPSMNKNDVSAMLKEDIPHEARVVLKARQMLGKTSLAKYAVLKRLIADDGRVHGLLLFHAATTGRWGGRLFQPHNLPRPSFDDADECIELIKSRDIDYLSMMYDDPMEAMSSCIRGMLIPGKGKTFYGGDYSSIEARCLSWISGQEDKLEVFRTHGLIYEHTASQIYEKNIDGVTKTERFIGKVSELALGYMGGGNAFVEMASVYDTRQYDVDISKEFGEKIKKQWRKNNPEIVFYWKAAEAAAIAATNNPGYIYSINRMKEAIKLGINYGRFTEAYNKIGDVHFTMKNNFLFCRMPSGRFNAYNRPHVKWVTVRMFKTPSIEDPDVMVNTIFNKHDWTPTSFKKAAAEANAEIISFNTPQLRFYGINSINRQWERQATYGGKIVQNICEGICRDVLGEAMLRLNRKKYDIVLTVHDEILSEKEHGNEEEMKELMEVLPTWATGFPIAAECYEAVRYRK